MIDIHSHLLPGVDDGARTPEAAHAVLARFARDGVSRLVCTPHLRASESMSAPREKMEALARSLAASAPETPPLSVGWEIMLDTTGMDLTSPKLRLAESRAILVEFPRTGVPPRAVVELARIRRSGLVPVLAHPERYWGASIAHVREWREAGIVIQCDAISMGGEGQRGRLARALLAGGMVDMLASDNHGDGRSLAAARQWLEEQGAVDQARLLTAENPRRLLADEPVEAVPPLAEDVSLLTRLKQLLLGRA